ncbi:hypothetical protein [Poseidonibacter ostreae]|uniref:Uncharacterized protein n=1 Tax=Poseidonibacter ostreae TaxID=2654171 RepID=A0A6L4WWS8_9BACT|nr:hypothetical protein [Poseidonibacter ostreae]KAB7891388.1 hypothetical protein GBG19_00700 [Poseidonibacter ostreae]
MKLEDLGIIKKIRLKDVNDKESDWVNITLESLEEIQKGLNEARRDILMSYERCIACEKKMDNVRYWEINGISIDETIFREEKHQYRFNRRVEVIANIEELIKEVEEAEKEAMIKDIDYLNSLKLEDEYILSHVSINDYVAFSDNHEKFNKICKEILKLNKGLIQD